MGFFEAPDNLDAFEEYEAEQDRIHRMHKRIAHEWGDDWEEEDE